jgi:hypothetical protein
VKGEWRYLYRAVDKYGETIDFLFTEHRDKEAALRFLKKAIRRHGVPETITIDGSEANEAAIKSYNQEHGTTISIRQVKYLNNIVEQDHGPAGACACRSILSSDRGYAQLAVRIKKGIDSHLGGENLYLSHCGYTSWPCCILLT